MISVCVATVRGNTVGHLVDSILRQSHTDWELILVAQGGDPGLLSAMHRQTGKDPRVRVIRAERLGRSVSLNLAVSQARGGFVAFTDDDCEAQEDWLSVIEEHFLRLPEVGIVAGDLRPRDRPRWLSICPATWTTPLVYKPSEHDYAGMPGYYWAGANFAARREVFESIGGFDPYLGPGTAYQAAEDTDFGLRAELLDITVATTPRAVIYHTYGRRVGLRPCLRHLRAYAGGQGALGGKLELMRHAWTTQKKDGPSISDVFRPSSFKRLLLNFYQDPYRARAKQDYLRRYRVGPNNVTVPIIGGPNVENPAVPAI